MTVSNLERNARAYARLFGLQVDFNTPIGFGNDGKVWSTENRTAIKAIERQAKYDKELECYQRFAANRTTNIDDFTLPRLINYRTDLLVIEITLVSPPYIIDFAKVWLDAPPDYPEDAAAERIRQAEEDFGDDWPKVARLLSTLRRQFGIHYVDPNLGNIKLRADTT